MITEENKNLWDFDVEQYYRIITTNGNIKKNGEAVMGKGIALQAKERYPELPTLLAYHIKTCGNTIGISKEHKIITFPTKNNYWEKSSYELIKESCHDLFILCIQWNIEKIVMPMVGCSNGGLKWDEVKKIIYEKLDSDLFDVTIARI